MIKCGWVEDILIQHPKDIANFKTNSPTMQYTGRSFTTYPSLNSPKYMQESTINTTLFKKRDERYQWDSQTHRSKMY